MKEQDFSEDFIPPKSTKDPELGTSSLDLIASFFRYIDEDKLFPDITLLPAEASFPHHTSIGSIKPAITVYKPKSDGTKRIVAMISEYATKTYKTGTKHIHLTFQYVDYCENETSDKNTLKIKDPNGTRIVTFYASTSQSHYGKSAPGKIAKCLYWTLVWDML